MPGHAERTVVLAVPTAPSERHDFPASRTPFVATVHSPCIPPCTSPVFRAFTPLTPPSPVRVHWFPTRATVDDWRRRVGGVGLDKKPYARWARGEKSLKGEGEVDYASAGLTDAETLFAESRGVERRKIGMSGSFDVVEEEEAKNEVVP
ncbi:hypothetical protein DFP72DRAFT_1049696 [Ephemerocybe angulata]|uniref:Uncharacterized protein n=1 Tax=Ephemerocybe angulata TaxID=980116 RepID=A0A8H6M1L0_9AGAR|nr:hypothetical protein DFP72DRAFT_1049696 [Tulosesus angulatus]